MAHFQEVLGRRRAAGPVAPTACSRPARSVCWCTPSGPRRQGVAGQPGHSLPLGQCCRASCSAWTTRSTFSRVALQPRRPIRSTWGRVAQMSGAWALPALAEVWAEQAVPPSEGPPTQGTPGELRASSGHTEPPDPGGARRAQEGDPGRRPVKATPSRPLSGHSVTQAPLEPGTGPAAGLPHGRKQGRLGCIGEAAPRDLSSWGGRGRRTQSAQTQPPKSLGSGEGCSL